MRIFVLNGSPKEKSDTMRLTRAFLKGLQTEENQEITCLRAIDQQVGPCLGCFGCWAPGAAGCVQHDGMEGILEQILQADLVLFSFPLYCYGMPSPLKAIVDRMLPLSRMDMLEQDGRVVHRSRYDMQMKKFLMICGCGFPSFPGNFDPAVQQFRNLFGKDAQAICISEAPMLNVPAAAPLADSLLAKMEQAGRMFAEHGCLDDATIAALETPMLPREVYLDIINGGGPAAQEA